MEAIIIDSASHEWSGLGGCVEINEKLSVTKFKNNSWAAWSETTPRHEAFVQKLLQSPVHVITCTRSKTETIQGEDKKVKKIGLKDVQREGWEYEFTIALSIDRDTHCAIASKDRSGIFNGIDPFVITEQTGIDLLEWCNQGESEQEIKQKLVDAYIDKVKGSPIFSDDEKSKYIEGCDKWSEFKLNNAISRVDELIQSRPVLADSQRIVEIKQALNLCTNKIDIQQVVDSFQILDDAIELTLVEDRELELEKSLQLSNSN
jgi:hypothetical protein